MGGNLDDKGIKSRKRFYGFIAITLILCISLTVVLSLTFSTKAPFQAQESDSQPETSTSSNPVPDANTSNSSFLTPQPGLFVELSPWSGIDGSLRVTQGSSISINVTLTSLSNQTEFTVPLYLAIGAYQNQPLKPGYKVITTPPAPYSSQLPWPAGDIDSSTEPKPFTATFDSNPIVLKQNETKTTSLTIHAAANTSLGAYSMVVELGNWQQTNVGGTTFQLTVQSASSSLQPKNGEYLNFTSDYLGGAKSNLYLVSSQLYYGTYNESFTRSGATGYYTVNEGDPCVVINGTIRNEYDKDYYFAITAHVYNSTGNKIEPVLTINSPQPGFTVTQVNKGSTGFFEIQIKYDGKDIANYDLFIAFEPTETPPP